MAHRGICIEPLTWLNAAATRPILYTFNLSPLTMTSASMESQIKSLNPNEEGEFTTALRCASFANMSHRFSELLVNYRLSHPTTDVRSLTKGIAGRVAHLIPSAQQEELAKSTAERRDDLKLEMTKHVWTLRRSQRAVEVQQRESLSLDCRTEEMGGCDSPCVCARCFLNTADGYPSSHPDCERTFSSYRRRKPSGRC